MASCFAVLTEIAGTDSGDILVGYKYRIQKYGHAIF